MSAARDLKTQLREDLAELESLREEARMRLNLASKDAKATFKELEGKLDQVRQRLVADGGEIAMDAATRLTQDLKDAFRRFKDRLSA